MEGSYNSLSTNEKNVAQSFKALCRKGSESKIPNYWLHCFHHNILHAYKKKKKPSLIIIMFTFFYQLSAEAFSFLSNQSKYFNTATLDWRRGRLTSRGIWQDHGKSIADLKVVNLAQQYKTGSFPNQIQERPINSLSPGNKFGKPIENPLLNITLFLAFFHLKDIFFSFQVHKI